MCRAIRGESLERSSLLIILLITGSLYKVTRMKGPLCECDEDCRRGYILKGSIILLWTASSGAFSRTGVRSWFISCNLLDQHPTWKINYLHNFTGEGFLSFRAGS